MPLFRVTVKQSKLTSGIRIERGMSVDVVTNSMSNPLTTNGGQAVADACISMIEDSNKPTGWTKKTIC